MYNLRELTQVNPGDEHFSRSDLMTYRFEKLKKPVVPTVRNFFERFEKDEPRLPNKFYLAQYCQLSAQEQELLRNRAERVMAEVVAPEMSPIRIHSRALFGKFQILAVLFLESIDFHS
jgi:hypothetical protein